MRTRIAALKHAPKVIRPDFANERCRWWKPKKKNAIVAGLAFDNGYYIEAYLLREHEQLILYLKYYTI